LNYAREIKKPEKRGALTSGNSYRVHPGEAIMCRAGFPTGGIMIARSFLAAAALAAAAAGAMTAVPTPARAQSNVEAEMIDFHRLCDKGDRRACVRFGILAAQPRRLVVVGEIIAAPSRPPAGGLIGFGLARQKWADTPDNAWRRS
jgi:hypothetical protein